MNGSSEGAVSIGITETVLSVTPAGRSKEWRIPIDTWGFLRLEVRG